jgi:hypothetical protein
MNALANDRSEADSSLRGLGLQLQVLVLEQLDVGGDILGSEGRADGNHSPPIVSQLDINVNGWEIE